MEKPNNQEDIKTMKELEEEIGLYFVTKDPEIMAVTNINKEENEL